MKSKKWIFGLIVFLIGLVCLPMMHGLAEGGNVPMVLCAYPYNVFYGVGLDEVIREMGCGLESDGEGNTYYVVDAEVTIANEDFVASLKDAFGALPFADVEEIEGLLDEKGSLSFEMVDDAGVVTTVDLLDEYMGTIRLRRLINEVYSEYVGFYQENINADVLTLGGLDFLLNDTYELPKSTLTVHLLDPMTWYEMEWLERSLVFDLGDDFEMVKEMVFSTKFVARYTNVLSKDLMTKEQMESRKANLLAEDYYSEDEVEYSLRNLGLGREVDGDWMKISLTNGIVLGLIFDEDKQQIEIWQSFDRLDVPLNSVALLYGEDTATERLSSLGDLTGSVFDPYVSFPDADLFMSRLIRYADGRIIYSSRFEYSVGQYKNGYDQQEEDFAAWMNMLPARDRYLTYVDEINTGNMLLTLKSTVIDNKSVFYDLLEKNFNEHLFAVGEVVDVFTEEREMSHLIDFSDLYYGGPSYQDSYKFFAFGDAFYEVKNYMLSEAYQGVLAEQFGENFIYMDPDEYEYYMGHENTDENLIFLVNGVQIEITFINSKRQILVSEVVYGLDRNLDEYDTPPMTIERLGFDCDGSNASVVMVNEPIELWMSYDSYYQLEDFWGSLVEGTAFEDFEVFYFSYDLDLKNLYFTLGGDVEENINPVYFVVYENWSYAPEYGSGIGELNAAYEENFGVDAETGIPAFLTAFQDLFVTEFGVTFEELVDLNLRQYTDFYAQY